MTSGQWRVLALLGALLGIEMATSKEVRQFCLDFVSGKGVDKSIQGAPQALLGYGFAGLALVAIAAWQEGFATAIVLVFLLLVLINKSDQIAPAVTAAGGAIRNLTGKNDGQAKK